MSYHSKLFHLIILRQAFAIEPKAYQTLTSVMILLRPISFKCKLLTILIPR